MKDVARPQVTLLDEEQLNRIHSLSLTILGKVGIRVDSPPAREVFTQHLSSSVREEPRILIPEGLVHRAIETAPSSVDVFDRLGDPAFTLGKDTTRFGMGVTTLYYLDAQTNRVAPFQRKDMCEAVRLGNGLEHFDVISTIGIPQDVPPHLVDFYSILDMVANTEKPLIVLVSEDSAFPPVLDLLEGLFPRAVSSPFILPYFNPITPLVMNASTTDKMLVAMDRGLGFIFSNYGMVGVSTPITLFETISLLNAELLAALTFSQLAHEGAPIILGSMPAFFDMRTMVSFYEPKTMMLNLACAELMSHYGIPHCGTSGSTTGWGPDVQAAGEQMLNQVSSLMGKAGLAPFVGSVLGGKVFSPENAVLADEIIAKARRFADGFVMERDPTVWGELLHAEPGASFLSAEATLQQFRTAYRESVIFPRWSFEAWQDRGSPGSRGQLRTHTLHLLETLAPPEDCERVTAAGEQLIRDFASHSFI